MKRKIYELIRIISKGVSISEACRITKIDRKKLYYRSPKLQLYLLSLSVVSKKHNDNTIEMKKYKHKIDEKPAIVKDNEYWLNYFRQHNKNMLYEKVYNNVIISTCKEGTYLTKILNKKGYESFKKISDKKLTEKQIEKYRMKLLKEI